MSKGSSRSHAASIVEVLARGREEGPRVLIVGAMHGNEPVGVRWVEAFTEAVERGALRLVRGEIHFLLGNPTAFAQGVRHCGFDLNRAFRSEMLHKTPPWSPDVARAQEIVAALAGAHYDVVLDLHSVSRGDPAMVVVQIASDASDREVAQYKGMFPPAFPIVFAYRPGDVPGVFLDWAREHLGAREVYAVECGNHESPRGIHRAWAFARWLLGERWGMVEGDWPAGSDAMATQEQRVYRVVERIDASERFAWTLPKDRLHSEQMLAAGEVYARRGTLPLRAPEEVALMMPALSFAPQDEAIAFLCRRVA